MLINHSDTKPCVLKTQNSKSAKLILFQRQYFKTTLSLKKHTFSLAPFVENFFITNYFKNGYITPCYTHLRVLNNAIISEVQPSYDNQSSTGLTKKLLRSSFLKSFTKNFPLACSIKSQTLITACFRDVNLNTLKKLQRPATPVFSGLINSRRFIKTDNTNNDSIANPFQTILRFEHSNLDNTSVKLMKAEWIMQYLINNAQISKKHKKNLALKRSIGQIIRQAGLLIHNYGSKSPLLGLKITIAGRINNRKKAMAQKFTRSIGQIPLSSFQANIDYSQRSVKNRFGIVGIKIWACYK